MWFAFSGVANIAVTFNAPISTYTLSPMRSGIPSNVTDGNTVNFTLNVPTKVCLKQVNGTTDYLYVIADPPETGAPASDGPGIYNVVNAYGADAGYSDDATSAINNAISDSAAAGGGIVYIPEGHYKIGSTGQSIQLQSNVAVYLAPGALLQVPPGTSCCFHNSSVLYSENDSNAEIFGRGVIYGSGTNQGLFFWLYSSEAQTDFRIQDVMFLDSKATSIRLQSNGVTVENAKIIALPGGLADGIDLESASNITIDNTLILSSDDNVELGTGTDTWGVISPMDNISVTNSLFMNSMSGHTFGVTPHLSIPGMSHIQNLNLDNNDTIDTDSVLGIYPFGGTSVSNIRLTNFQAENIRSRPFEIWAGDCTSWGPGNCGTTMTGEVVGGSVTGVTIGNVNFGTYGSQPSQVFVGLPSAYVGPIQFNQSVIAGSPITSAADMHLDLKTDNISAVTFTFALSRNKGRAGVLQSKSQGSRLNSKAASHVRRPAAPAAQ